MSDQGNQAAWRPDPQGRHELRYWDGSAWTDHVSDAGATSTDPMTSGPSPTDTVAVPLPVAPRAPGTPPPGSPGAPPPGVPVAGGPTPPPGAPVWSGGVPGAPPSSSKKRPGWVLPAAIVGGVIALIVILALVFGSDNSATDFEAGECTNDSLRGEIDEIDTVDCEEEHDFEAIGTLEFEGDDDDYPSDEEIAEEIVDQCQGELFEEYVGVDDYDESIYIAEGIPPTEDSWEDAGLREGVCLITGTVDGDDLEGSAEGSEE